MKICAKYSFNKGEPCIKEHYPKLLTEIEEIIASVDANKLKTKISDETTMPGQMLFSPPALNKAFKSGFQDRGWASKKVYCDYPTTYYVEGYSRQKTKGPRPYREMDFLKEKLGVEVQFGKYTFMVYDVCAKMTIFKNLGFIDSGVEIVPMYGFSQEMSTGVSYFEQFAWDLDNRGVGSIDIPVLILGVEADVLVEAEEVKEVIEQ